MSKRIIIRKTEVKADIDSVFNTQITLGKQIFIEDKLDDFEIKNLWESERLKERIYKRANELFDKSLILDIKD